MEVELAVLVIGVVVVPELLVVAEAVKKGVFHETELEVVLEVWVVMEGVRETELE